MQVRSAVVLCFMVPFCMLLSGGVLAESSSPWGHAAVRSVDYRPAKVVYDVAVASEEEFSRVLDRASFLNNLYHADPFATSIILVLHGDEIPFFAIDNHARYESLMTRARSLTVGGTIGIRMCKVAAQGHGLDPEDIHGFVELVPMADAEIVRLQQEEGYAYMQ